jgi:hypothetical protein
MTENEFSFCYSYLCEAYNKDINENQMLIWYDFFRDYDVNTFKQAVIQAINENKYFPSIAEVKNCIVKQNNPQINLKADEEWEKVREVARSIGRYEEERALSMLEPITRNIVRRIGYQDICNADEYSRNNLRNAFIRAFDSEKEDLIKYDKSNNLDRLEMQLVYERNKDFLSNKIGKLVKRIDEEE